MTEAELAAQVAAHLAALGADVHQEVQLRTGGARADLVALLERAGGRPPLVHVVECKLALGFDVLAQADWWRRSGAAHYVSVATPAARNTRGRQFAGQLLRGLGVGLYAVDDARDLDGRFRHPVQQDVPPRLQRWPAAWFARRRLRECCVDQTRWTPAGGSYAAAGTNRGGYWSPFKRTCEAIRAELARRGPMKTRDLVAAIPHHYQTDATARSTLPRWLEAGKIPGVRAVPNSRPLLWELDPTAPKTWPLT